MTTTQTPTPTEYARNAGAEYRQILATDPAYGFQGQGLRPMVNTDDLPEGDYIDLRQQFGKVTPEMERAYREGFNA